MKLLFVLLQHTSSKMIQLRISFVGILLLLLPLNQAQFDPEWCEDSPPPEDIDPNWRTIPDRFEILAELVQDKEAMEITQAFSRTRDSIAKNSGRGSCLFIGSLIVSL